MSARVSVAAVRSVSIRFAQTSEAPVRSAPTRDTPMSVASLRLALTRFTRLRFMPVRVALVRSMPRQSGAQDNVMGSCAGMLTATSASTAAIRGPRSRGLIPRLSARRSNRRRAHAGTDSPHLVTGRRPTIRRDLGQLLRWRRMMAT